ncbi:unnamed protein product [Mytilus coruscus]|uniref:Uncharacterized protein n=1 Tax=Mytilus coruscus TaxID=42192 RepID=A0A6J8CJ65_MYTCO|nr:unnamed protein product [Mytilus coruscus]
MQEKSNGDYEDYFDRLKKSSEHQKRLYDLRKHEHTFETGDLVYAMDTAKKIGKNPKLQPQWKGKYVVNKRQSKEVETRLQGILEDEVSDMDEVSLFDSNVPSGLRPQAPDLGGTLNKNDKQSQELVAVTSDDYDAFPEDESDNSNVNITENTIKDSSIQDSKSESKEVISLDSGTHSPVSGDILTHVENADAKKTEFLIDPLTTVITTKTDASSDSSESRTQAPGSHGNHQMTEEGHPTKTSRYGRKINQPLRFKNRQ